MSGAWRYILVVFWRRFACQRLMGVCCCRCSKNVKYTEKTEDRWLSVLRKKYAYRNSNNVLVGTEGTGEVFEAKVSAFRLSGTKWDRLLS